MIGRSRIKPCPRDEEAPVSVLPRSPALRDASGSSTSLSIVAFARGRTVLYRTMASNSVDSAFWKCIRRYCVRLGVTDQTSISVLSHHMSRSRGIKCSDVRWRVGQMQCFADAACSSAPIVCSRSDVVFASLVCGSFRGCFPTIQMKTVYDVGIYTIVLWACSDSGIRSLLVCYRRIRLGAFGLRHHATVKRSLTEISAPSRFSLQANATRHGGAGVHVRTSFHHIATLSHLYPPSKAWSVEEGGLYPRTG